MQSGSWASYQAALPLEARAGGEPDDDDKSGLISLPAGYSVEWLHEELCGDGEVHTVRSMRCFLGESHGGDALAWRAAVWWEAAMLRRHGKGNVWLDMVD